MNLIINGEEKVINTTNENISLEEILIYLNVKNDLNHIAIAVNENVIKKDDWNKPIVKSGDVIEIIHAVQGG
ncbi:MAG: sulfur carrier protein ThiS [Melioribacteraceae bacterium]